MLQCLRGIQSNSGLDYSVTTELFFHDSREKAILGGVSPKKTDFFFIRSPRTKGPTDSYFLTYSRILDNFLISFFSTPILPSNQ